MNPPDLKYTSEHEWVRMDGDEAVVGITEFAQDQLGDVVYVELPAIGARVEQNKQFGVVESVKTASDLYSPLSGEVIAVNETLADEPQVVNDAPYGEGWMIRVRPDNLSELESLLSAEQYADLTGD
ncbi:MAG TPA: glycine cleavage system protein GcvH [Chloroflexota bacterium]|nr:glycine cleavage system protein GcvH [Chloroflexota bacterium]